MNIAEFVLLKPTWSEILRKASRFFWRSIFRALQSFAANREKPEKLYLIAAEVSVEDQMELKIRSDFYIPTVSADQVIRSGFRVPMLWSSDPILVFGPRTRFIDWLITSRPGTFDVDFRRNPMDGWAWTGLVAYLERESPNLQAVQQRLNDRIRELKDEGRSKCYVFGTGPTLEKAMDRNWDDGYRIVCNTIVRDAILWNHIAPDFVVAGDAIYHFGHTEFARAFRQDLRSRLEDSRALFIYPAQFHAIVIREFARLEEQLIPIPSGRRWVVNTDLAQSFQLPNLGNVLGLLLLPLACTLSKRIFLFGFDGRAPADKLFWSNSNKHTYPEYMDSLKKAHPRFFDHYVPANDPNKYVRENQGDQLERSLQFAEKAGWTFEMMHPSWTPTLQKRFHGDH